MAPDENYYDKIPALRETFADLFAGSINSGVYDERDIERIRLDDENARAYLRHQKGNVEKAAAMMDSVLKWRQEMEINELSDKYFPREFHELGAVYWHNHDNKGQKILYFAVRKNKKDPEKLPLVKKFIAWQINKHFIKHPDQRIVALLDMTDAGFGNMDMDLIKYQISCFTTFFPGILSYMLIYEMPWVLNAIWKVIKTLLSAEQQKAVIFVKRGEVQNYISADQLWKHMGGTDTYEYTYIPSEDSGIDINNGEMATPTEDDEPEDLFQLAAENTSSHSPSSSVRKRVTFSEKDPVVYTSFEAENEELNTNQSNLSNNNRSPQPPLNIAQRRASAIENSDNVHVTSLLTICPADELEFCLQEDSKDAIDVLSLSNISDQNVAYKVKTTSPEKYRVRPSTGIIAPGGQAEVNVYLHSGQDVGVSKDKFLIMFMAVQEETSVSQVNDLFKVTFRDSYSEHRLRCRLGQAYQKSASKLLESPQKSSSQSSIEVITQKLVMSESEPLLRYNMDEWSSDTSLSSLNFSFADPEMDALMLQQKRFEARMKTVQWLLALLLFLVFLICLSLFLVFWLEYLPVNKYTVSTCSTQPL